MVDNCEEEEVLKSTLLHVRRAVFLLAAAERLPKTLPKKHTYAPNMNSEKQCKFKSTKAKRTASQPKLSKPSLEQIVV